MLRSVGNLNDCWARITLRDVAHSLQFPAQSPRGNAARGRVAARWLRRPSQCIALLLDSPRWPALRPRETTRLRSAPAQTRFAGQKRTPASMRVLRPLSSRAGSRDHPPQAPGLNSRRSPPKRSFADALVAHHRWCAATSLQRRARPGRGANQAQAPAVDGLAAQRRYERAARRIASGAYVSCSRNVFEPERSAGELFRGGRKAGRRGESGSSAMHCDGRRSHRAATRPCAALPRGGCVRGGKDARDLAG